EKGADVSASDSDWSAGNIFVPLGADESFADQSGADTSALVPSLSCAHKAHIRKTHIINCVYVSESLPRPNVKNANLCAKG
ncbi:hypothetical protein Tco_0392186, partial [Tanacetum coccineum]